MSILTTSNGTWPTFGGKVLTPYEQPPQPPTPDFDVLMLDMTAEYDDTGAAIGRFTIADRYNTNYRHPHAISTYGSYNTSGYLNNNTSGWNLYTPEQLANISAGGTVTNFHWTRLIFDDNVMPTLFRIYYKFESVLNPPINLSLWTYTGGAVTVIARRTIQPQHYDQYVYLIS